MYSNVDGATADSLNYDSTVGYSSHNPVSVDTVHLSGSFDWTMYLAIVSPPPRKL